MPGFKSGIGHWQMAAINSCDFEESYNDDEPNYLPRQYKRPKCYYCGKKNLIWKEVDSDGWRLHQMNYNSSQWEPHTCKEYFEHKNKRENDKKKRENPS